MVGWVLLDRASRAEPSRVEILFGFLDCNAKVRKIVIEPDTFNGSQKQRKKFCITLYSLKFFFSFFWGDLS